MLTILGGRYRFCDGLSRRGFLTIGGLALGRLSLPDILRAEAHAARKLPHKAVIMIYLPGGPAHLDLYDLKPDAPLEIRGPFRPIQTRVPGIHICEHLPRLAEIMDRLVLIRSLVGAEDDHASHLCLTGRSRRAVQSSGGWPYFGSVVSKLQGPVERSVPPLVDLAARMEHEPYNNPGPAFLGAGHGPFRPEGQGMADLVLNGISLDRLADRKALLAGFDRFRRDADAQGMMQGMDSFVQQAFGVLASSKLVEALDVAGEDQRVRQRYGRGDPRVEPTLKASPRLMEPLLVARRLVEAGVRCVSVSFGAWDWHEKNFVSLKEDLPLFDQGVSALVEDLYERGLDRDVAVIAWGEFGRTPKINNLAGRDHWPKVACALLAGGGLRAGQLVGSTNRLGEQAQDRPVSFQEVFATLYHHLGIDVHTTTVNDLAGRPQYLLDQVEPIRELV